VSGYLGALFSAALFFSTSYIWRSLETSLVAVLASLLVYLILSLVRIYIARKRKRAEEGEI
jgi:VIT1/CCC1 family predicted Fe2+/Mn2+ transporter